MSYLKKWIGGGEPIRPPPHTERVKYLILAPEAKVDFKKVVQFNDKHCQKGLMKISRVVYKLEPLKYFFSPSGQSLPQRSQVTFRTVHNLMKNIAEEVSQRYTDVQIRAH